ncbi:MAG: hypothetical protein Q8M35_07495, partial [Pseudohongiella sp.]|nr:hypothetical protein [Pseudohongiella sp.]
MNVTRKLFYLALTGCCAVTAMPVVAQSEARDWYVTAYAQASRLNSSTFDEIGNANLGTGLKAAFDAGLGLGGDVGFRY